MSRKPKVPTRLPPFDKEVEIRGFLFSRALTQTTCVVPAANSLKPRFGKTTRIRIMGNLGADDAGEGVTGEARRARRSGGTGICQKQRQAHAEPLHPSSAKARSGSGSAGGRRTGSPASPGRRFRAAPGAHRPPRAPALCAGPTFAPKFCCPGGRRRTCPHLSPAGDTIPPLPPSSPPASDPRGPRDPVPYQVSPFRSEVLSSVAMSERWVSRSAAPPSAIFFH